MAFGVGSFAQSTTQILRDARAVTATYLSRGTGGNFRRRSRGHFIFDKFPSPVPLLKACKVVSFPHGPVGRQPYEPADPREQVAHSLSQRVKRCCSNASVILPAACAVNSRFPSRRRTLRRTGWPR